MTPEQWVTLILGLAGGGSVVHGVRLILERRDGTTERRRAEEERLYKLLCAERARADEAEEAEDVSARRLRIALELLSLHRRMLYDLGVPHSQMPTIDLGGR